MYRGCFSVRFGNGLETLRFALDLQPRILNSEWVLIKTLHLHLLLKFNQNQAVRSSTSWTLPMKPSLSLWSFCSMSSLDIYTRTENFLPELWMLHHHQGLEGLQTRATVLMSSQGRKVACGHNILHSCNKRHLLYIQYLCSLECGVWRCHKEIVFGRQHGARNTLMSWWGWISYS